VGLLDVLRGRTKQAPANLDAIFALPTAAITLESACNLVPTGHGGICFKAGSGAADNEARKEIDALLADEMDPTSIRRVDDDLGFTWIVVDDPDLSSLVTRLHGANDTLEEHGLGAHLLCAVVSFTDAPGSSGSAPCYLVYLFKQGTFYPFAPRDGEQRDNELELRLRAQLEGDLPIEQDLTKWLALWGLPVAS
jgi:hypothetical protein